MADNKNQNPIDKHLTLPRTAFLTSAAYLYFFLAWIGENLFGLENFFLNFLYLGIAVMVGYNTAIFLEKEKEKIEKKKSLSKLPRS